MWSVVLRHSVAVLCCLLPPMLVQMAEGGVSHSLLEQAGHPEAEDKWGQIQTGGLLS